MSQSDATQEAKRLEEQRGGGDPYAAALRATRMPIAITDARIEDNPIVFANDAFVRLSGYAREEIIGRNCRFLQGPETDRAQLAQIADAIGRGESVSAEILNYRKTGETFWNALYISPVFDEAGEITHFFGSQLDVTERKRSAAALAAANAELEAAKESAEKLARDRTIDLERALEQKTLLLHEVDHRVKNNLQLISSLILLQSRRVSDPQARQAMKSMLERVSALASVHRNLFQSEDVSRFDVPIFVRTIAQDLLDSTGREDIELTFETVPVTTTASRAAPIALVVNELLTNALRHAFPGRGGRIRLAVEDLGSSFAIEIEDNGVGRATQGDETFGFGQSLIDLLGKQLSAEIERRDAEPGVAVRVVVPELTAAGRKPI